MADRLAPLPRRLLGLGMVALVIAVLALCVAVYNKAFTRVVPVTVQIDQSDNSLLPQAEVRMRGVTVGEVTSITTDGKDATLHLALDPSEVPHIPSNVQVRLLPKTLFGERFVSLVSPAQPAPTAITAGAVISPDRSRNAIETEQVFNDLLPLIQAVRPADLASALGAVNQALAGRGQQVGDTVTLLHHYLSQFNPALPDLTSDIRALPKFTDTYSTAAPNLIEGLKDLTTTTQTLDEEQDQLETLFRTVTEASDDLTDFLEDNKSNLINLVHTARPPLELLARYSPEYVCLFNRLAAAVPLAKPVFGDEKPRPALHVTVDIVVSRGPYRPHQDEPEFTDNRGPACYDNTPPLPQYPGGPYQDGSTHPPASSQAVQLGNGGGSPLRGLPGPALGGSSGSSGSGAGAGQPSLPFLGGTGSGGADTRSGSSPDPAPALGGLLGMPAKPPAGTGPPQAMGASAPAVTASIVSIANSAPERDVVAGLVADMTGADRSAIPAWSSLLVGPLLRGVEVQVR
jgi:virulence factor Mce-like protein